MDGEKKRRMYACPHCEEGHPYSAGHKFCKNNPKAAENRSKIAADSRKNYYKGDNAAKLQAGYARIKARDSLRKSKELKEKWRDTSENSWNRIKRGEENPNYGVGFTREALEAAKRVNQAKMLTPERMERSLEVAGIVAPVIVRDVSSIFDELRRVEDGPIDEFSFGETAPYLDEFDPFA